MVAEKNAVAEFTDTALDTHGCEYETSPLCLSLSLLIDGNSVKQREGSNYC